MHSEKPIYMHSTLSLWSFPNHAVPMFICRMLTQIKHNHHTPVAVAWSREEPCAGSVCGHLQLQAESQCTVFPSSLIIPSCTAACCSMDYLPCPVTSPQPSIHAHQYCFHLRTIQHKHHLNSSQHEPLFILTHDVVALQSPKPIPTHNNNNNKNSGKRMQNHSDLNSQNPFTVQNHTETSVNSPTSIATRNFWRKRKVSWWLHTQSNTSTTYT